MKEGPLMPDENPIFSNPETIPNVYWQSLKDDCYYVNFLGFRCIVIINKKVINIENFPIKPNFQTYLVLLNYLNAQKVSLGSEWVLAKELKGGIHFFDRSHPLVVKDVLENVRSKENLLKAFKMLKGRELDFGDAAYELEVFPEVRLRYIYFEGDDEFPSELTINFQKGIENMLPLDVIWAMVNVINKILVEFLKH